MTDTTRPARRRILYAVPVIGWILRDIDRDFDNIWYLIAAVVSLLAIATMTWGVQVLTLAALTAVPAMFVVLIRITRG
jgi:hypothetical protein